MHCRIDKVLPRIKLVMFQLSFIIIQFDSIYINGICTICSIRKAEWKRDGNTNITDRRKEHAGTVEIANQRK